MTRGIIILFCFLIHTLAGAEHEYPIFHYPPQEQSNDERYLEIYEDAQSLIWIGSSEGLYSFDGVKFQKQYQETPAEDFIDINALYKDSKGVLWVGTAHGQIFQLKNHVISKWEIEEGLPVKPIQEFIELRNQIWFATYGEGVYYWENERLYNLDTDDGLSSNEIYSMIKGPGDEIWVSTDAGIDIISTSKDSKKIRHINRKDGLADEIVLTLFNDRDKSIIFGYFDEGIGVYQVDADTIKNYGNHTQRTSIQNVCYADHRYIWMSEEGGGLMRLDRKTGLYELIRLSGSHQMQIQDLYMGSEGNLWILDENRGLYSVQCRFSLSDMSPSNVQAIHRHRNGVLFIGTENGAYILSERNAEQEMKPIFKESKNVISLHVDRYDRLWIGTFGDGVYIFDLHTNDLTSLTQEDGIAENSILDISESGRSIFLSTLGGVSEIIDVSRSLHKNQIRIVNYDSDGDFGTNYIYHALVDQDNGLWFATDGKGLCVLDKDGIKSFTKSLDGSVNTVYSLAKDDKNRIWVSTPRNEIYYLEGEKFYPFSTWNTSYSGGEISAIVSDQNGQIIIIGSKGLHVIRPEKNRITTYLNYGFTEDFEPALNAVHVDDEGFVWIGGKTGLIRFDPQFSNFEQDVRIFLTDVKVFDQSINDLQEPTFHYRDNYLSIDFKGLWYTNPSSIRYRYMIEGLDGQWKYTSEPSASFYHLPAGKYHFVAEAALTDAFDQPASVSFDFRVLAPFWKRPLFILIALVISIFSIYWFMKLRENKIQNELKRKKKMIEAQFQTLKSQINPHFLFNSFNTLASTIEENPQAAVEYVEYLSDFYRSILQYREKNLIPLEEEIELVKNYMYLLQKRFGENVSLNVQLNGEPKNIAPLSLQLLVENAVKHNVISKIKPLKINITVDPEDFITVSNNIQKKSSIKDSTNYGLDSLVQRYKLLSDQPVQIIQTKQSFTVKIPSIKNIEK